MDGADRRTEASMIMPAGALQEMSELADLLADMRDRLEDLIVEMEADPATDMDKELIGEARHWMELSKAKSKLPTVSQFEKSCAMCERMIERKPRPETMERIRRFLIMLIQPMRVTEVLQEVEDTPTPLSVAELAREYFGSQPDDGGSGGGPEELPMWYAGKMGAQEAEGILAHKVDGTYMIRESETSHGDHNVTIRNHNMVYHYRVIKTEDVMYLHPDKVFTDLVDLVAHYQEPIGAAGEHPFPVRLRFPFNSYASNPWYHGDITKAVAEDMLRPAGDSSFLVRLSQSSQNDLTLSLKVHDTLHHYRIVRNDDNTLSLSKDIRFQTLEKLIQFYARQQGGGIPTLRRALAREPERVIDPTRGDEYRYVNLTQKAKGSSVRPTGFLGTGFGRSGFYQRRWVQSLRSRQARAQAQQ